MLPFNSSRSSTWPILNLAYFASRTPSATFSKSQNTARLRSSMSIAIESVLRRIERAVYSRPGAFRRCDGAMLNPFLGIGNKNYSSWALRPWLLMKVKGIAFDERRIPLYQQQSKAAIFERSPSGKVPALRDGAVSVWESLAICEYVAERWPRTGCWPQDP